jgi:uncharacterized OB-fold protein
VALNRALTAVATGARPRIQDGALVGSRCTACGTRSWPSRAVCGRCGSDELAQEALPAVGELLSYTSVWVARGPFTPPYVLGQADFGEGAVVFGHVRGLPDDAHVPLPVSVVIAPVSVVIAPPGDEPLDFWFEPADP